LNPGKAAVELVQGVLLPLSPEHGQNLERILGIDHPGRGSLLRPQGPSEQEATRWTENPHWQFFCGEEFFRHSLPIHPCQMTRWQQRIGETGVEKLLQITIEAGKATKTITERSLEKVIMDTTVQPKAVQHPTDGRDPQISRRRAAACSSAGLASSATA